MPAKKKQKPSAKVTLEQQQARIGENIRRFRRTRAMTQQEQADELGLSTFFIGSVERGQSIASCARWWTRPTCSTRAPRTSSAGR